MARFQDNNGRTWDVDLTIGALDRIRAHLGLNLLAIEEGEPPLAVRIATDPQLVCQVLYEALAPQFRMANVSEEDFRDTMGPRELHAAYAAYAEALTDFFRQSGRPDRAAALDRVFEAIQKTTEKTAARLQGTDLDRLIDEVLASLSSTPGS